MDKMATVMRLHNGQYRAEIANRATNAHIEWLTPPTTEEKAHEVKDAWRAENLPTDVKSSVSAYLMARAYAETMREKVDEVHREILEECPIYTDMDERTQIFKSGDLYLSNDEEACKDFYAESNKRLRACNLKPDTMEDDYCPALVAEALQVDLERRVIEAGARMIGEPKDMPNRLLFLGLEKYNEFTDLVCRMVVNSPGFKNPLKS